MKHLIPYLVFTSSIFIATVALQAQDKATKSIQMIGRVSPAEVLLRWAPADPVAWQYGIKYGYVVERYTMTHGKTLLKPSIQKVLTPAPLLPATKERWIEIMDTNDYGAVAAQAIFGETFEVDPGNSTVVEIIQKVQESEQRYSFALFAADNSFEVAMLSALAFRDTTIQKDERYLYKVRINLPTGLEEVTPGLFFVKGDESAELLPPTDITIKNGDKAVLLQWSVSPANTMYTAYVIERSIDDKVYTNILKKPLIRMVNQDMIFRDSLADNTHDYYYRVRGVTPFGEFGPPSKPLVSKGVTPFPIDLAIHRSSVIGNQITLQWKVSGEETQVDNFILLRSTNNDGPYKQINTLPIPGKERMYSDKKPFATNYYKIVARNAKGISRESHPYLVQLEDSIPPVTPKALIAKIDTSGIVKLTWQANKEPDLAGYRIYRSNFKNSEFSQITHDPVTINAFTDTIPLRTLTSKIYYKIDAVDGRFNHSPFSEMAEVIKPDIVPPVSPVIKRVRSMADGVYLEWINSSSEDVTKHDLYRRKLKSETWNVIKTIAITDTLHAYHDVPPDADEYEYTLAAIDEHNLQSPYCALVKGRQLNSAKPQVKNISYTVDRTANTIKLTWKYPLASAYKFQVYRATANEPISLYKTVKGDSLGLHDLNVTMNTTYSYRVKALFKDGSESVFSDELRIEF